MSRLLITLRADERILIGNVVLKISERARVRNIHLCIEAPEDVEIRREKIEQEVVTS
jgi:sRNA-binding carbon storage regulator CsrA